MAQSLPQGFPPPSQLTYSEKLKRWLAHSLSTTTTEKDLHPHNNCSVCHGVESGKLDENGQLEALIRCIRTSAQDTLESLKRKGYEIRKKPD